MCASGVLSVQAGTWIRRARRSQAEVRVRRVFRLGLKAPEALKMEVCFKEEDSEARSK